MSEDRGDIAVVLAKLGQYCVAGTTEMYETYLFSKRSQSEAENIYAFTRALWQLAKNCNFGAYEERMLRDRVVAGARKDSVRRRPMEQKDLTLPKCVVVCTVHNVTTQ